MKFLKMLGIIILVLLLVIVILGLVAPKSYHVERSTVIVAPKDLVFSHVKYWQKWIAWNPWGKMDSAMVVTVEGTDGTVGSKYVWEGSPDLTGKGEMVATGIKENEQFDFHLHFLEPWEDESDGYLKLSDVENGTEVSWAFYGKTPFPWNVMMLFQDMDSMIGPDFEKGLAYLKEISENQYEAIKKYPVSEIEFPDRKYAAIRQTVKFQEISKFYEKSYSAIGAVLPKYGAVMSGAPCGIYYSFDEQKMITDLAAAIPVNKSFADPEVQIIEIPGGKAYKIDYYGPYEKIGDAHLAMDYYLFKHNLQQKPPVIEEYVTDPSAEPDSSKWLTVVYYFAQ